VGLSIERTYDCPVCATHLSVDAGADLVVLLHGRGNRVDHVVTADDEEVHRCRIQESEPGS
jgi:hypothetical protein